MTSAPRGPRPDGSAGEVDDAPAGTAKGAKDPLVIRDIEYLGPMESETGWRPAHGFPEIAFGGRSNVGKSSLINKLVRRKKLARVSNTPGRTRAIHFFRVNQDFVLVDLPGYGYARVSKERRSEWRPLIEGFLRRSPGVRGIVQLLDARHDPTADDEQMLGFLGELGLPTIVAATKIDKLPKGGVGKRVREIGRLIGMDESQIIPFSAITGEGRDDLASAIVSLIGQPSWREETSDVDSGQFGSTSDGIER
jgi:GTP-binding protein